MIGPTSNSNHVYQFRADILVEILVGIFAVLVGALIEIVGGVIPLLLYSFPVATTIILADYRKGVWLLVVILPFAETQLVPREVFGVTGLNPVNCLLMLTLLSLFVASLFRRGDILFVHLPRALLVYLAVIALAAYVGTGSADRAITIPGVIEPLTVTTYLLQNFAKPMIILIVAWLAAVFARNGNGRPLIWALAVAYVSFFVVIAGYIVIDGISLQILASSRTRGFLGWTGMHANEVGLMANLGFAILLYAAVATTGPLPRVILFVCAAAAAMMAALTFSRGAFIGLAIILGYYLLTRRRVGQFLLALSIIVGIGLIMPNAFVERATTGFQTADTDAITAGRLDNIWRPLLPTFWEAPIIGHGLSSTLWATPNLRGTMLPVGHPHSAYLGVLLDLGMVGVAVVAAFFWSVWELFRYLSKDHIDPQWRGVFEGGVVCLMCLAAQGLTDDRFVPTYPQVALWLCYGLALGHARFTYSNDKKQS
jgi:O-Antigen ligase